MGACSFPQKVAHDLSHLQQPMVRLPDSYVYALWP